MIYSKKAICVALACCCLSGTAFAQHVSLTMNNVTVKQAMDALKKQSGYSFVFSSEDVDTKKKVSVDADDQKVEEVVRQILDGQSVTYEIKGKNIVVRSIAQTSSSQQKKTITGTIVDPSGMPVIGANVMVKGTTNGTITDMDGKFSLEVPKESMLVVSYIGYANQEIKVSNQTNLSIALKEDAEALDELVVVGYGVQKKRDVTGSISHVKGEDLKNLPTANIANSLGGRVSGVEFVSGGGGPGNSPSIRIRGTGTINSSDPLIIVDGIVGGYLRDYNPNDIESIEILKDASASAIYGTRAANGVVIISTKKGNKNEKVGVSLNAYTAVSNVVNKLDLLTASDLVMLKKERYINNGLAPDDFWDDPYYSVQRTDWQDAYFSTGTTNNIDLSIKGGSKRASFYTSLGYYNEQGTIEPSKFRRYSIRVNSDY